MNPIKTVLQKAKKEQKEVCEITGIKQSTLSSRMNREMKGSIEYSIEIARELKVKSYSIFKDGCEIKVKIK